MDKEKCVNKKLHPYWKTGIYGWLGEEVDDNDYMLCPICGEILAMNYWDYSAEHDGDNKCHKCGQELDYSEIYDFEDTLYFRQLLEMKEEKIANIETKLKASEEKCHEQWLEIQAETHQIQMLKQDKERIKKNWQISKTHQQKLYNNLKQQNKAKGIVNYPITLDGCRITNEEQLLDFAKDFCQEKKYWQEQLAEKEKEETKRMEDFEKGCQEYYKSNQTAIAKLQKVLEWLNIPFDENGCLKNGEDLENYIEQQIAELKGEDV